jgi:hypothetical protein
MERLMAVNGEITDRGVVIEGISKSYDALSELDPKNNLLKYIGWNGEGFSYSSDSSVCEEFSKRFSFPGEEADIGRLVRYSNALNVEVGRMSSL